MCRKARLWKVPKVNAFDYICKINRRVMGYESTFFAVKIEAVYVFTRLAEIKGPTDEIHFAF